jgi:DNA repair photolyase
MLHSIQVKSVLNKTKKRDDWFLDDYTINPYSACSYNCLYCYIRGSKYGINMAEKLSVKSNALEVLEKQLAVRAKKNQQGFVVLSSATDPYLQIEAETKLTRGILELLLKYRFPVHIITKSDLVQRDFDILEQINAKAVLPMDLQNRLTHKVLITFSFSTLDQQVASIFESGAPTPVKRLQTLKVALERGFYSGVSLMPLLPYISDTGDQLESFYETFQKAGVQYVMPASLTLFGNAPHDGKILVLRAVEKHFPQLLERYQRFFAHSTEMPSYYRNAFTKKQAELSIKYNLKNKML